MINKEWFEHGEQELATNVVELPANPKLLKLSIKVELRVCGGPLQLPMGYVYQLITLPILER